MSSNQMRHSASSPNLTGSSTGLRRSVSFHKVEIREYDVTVGDNPSCRTGPALQLDWRYDKELEATVDDYETNRQSQRRDKQQMLVPGQYREDTLLQSGHTKSEISNLTKEREKIQKSRIRHANQSQTRQKADEMLESAKRKFSRFVSMKPGKEAMYKTTAASIPPRRTLSMNDLASARPHGILRTMRLDVSDEQRTESVTLDEMQTSINPSTRVRLERIDDCSESSIENIEGNSPKNDDRNGALFF